jgi:hypothetical protein
MTKRKYLTLRKRAREKMRRGERQRLTSKRKPRKAEGRGEKGENQVPVATCAMGPTLAFHVETYCWSRGRVVNYVE